MPVPEPPYAVCVLYNSLLLKLQFRSYSYLSSPTYQPGLLGVVDSVIVRPSYHHFDTPFTLCDPKRVTKNETFVVPLVRS